MPNWPKRHCPGVVAALATLPTNSQEANDVAMVHAGYAKYRKLLLEAGVQLFELRKLPGGESVEGQLQKNLMG